jgi:hypothetical protein
MSSQNAVVVPQPQPGTVARREFGADQLAVAGETSTALLAAQAEAMVKARFVVAMQRPRDFDDVRAKLLRACERPGFAGSATEKTWGAAWYHKPVGDGVEGFSIRFAEEALRCMGNIDVETLPIFEDATRRILRVTVLDLESNISIPTSVSIEKTVVRKYLKKGEEALRVIVNSRQETTYLVPATEDEVFQKQQSLASKAIRNGVLRLLPGDIQAECRTRMLAIRNGEAAKDPDGFRRKVADGFTKLNVLPSQLKDYLGHELAQSTPAELTDLRDLWKAIEEGRTTWAEAMAAAAEDRGEAPASGEAAEKKPALDALKEKLQAQAKADGCKHPDVPPSAVAGLKEGETVACKACGELLGNPEAEKPASVPPEGTPAAKRAAGQKRIGEA